MITEIDFVTCGIKPKGELFLRASEILLNFKKLKAKLSQRKNSLSEVTFRLIKIYVWRHEFIFKLNKVDTENWITKVKVWNLMTCGGMQGSLRDAFEFKGEIEKAAIDSEPYAIASKIIHEYETYCSHIIAIEKYKNTQAKIINSNRKIYLAILEKRDGLFCQCCGSVQNLVVDHIEPSSLGGKTEIENLQLLCRSCNSRKGNRPMSYLQRRRNRFDP